MGLLLALGACAGHTSLEIAAGYNVSKHMPWGVPGYNGGFDGASDTVRFTIRRDHARQPVFCAFNHISHLSVGWPVNGEPEDWLDNIECGLRFGARP